LTAKAIMRMQEVNLVADLLIAMREGIKSKKQIKKYYDQYEAAFTGDVELMEKRFDNVVLRIGKIYPEGLSGTEFKRPHVFYSLFTATAHCLYGLPSFSESRKPLASDRNIEDARNGLDRVEELFEAEDLSTLKRNEQQFLQDCRRATTDEKVRERRTKYLLAGC
jgi:hypothetical protein